MEDTEQQWSLRYSYSTRHQYGEASRLGDLPKLIQIFKSQNNLIVLFYGLSMTYDRYLELVEFVTVVGPADDKKRSFKYKFFQIFRYPLSSC
jgi:hypothetical protein